MDIIIPASLPFFVKEITDFGFQISKWYIVFVGVQSHSNMAWNPAYKDFFVLTLTKSFNDSGFSSFLLLNDSRTPSLRI